MEMSDFIPKNYVNIPSGRKLKFREKRMTFSRVLTNCGVIVHEFDVRMEHPISEV